MLKRQSGIWELRDWQAKNSKTFCDQRHLENKNKFNKQKIYVRERRYIRKKKREFLFSSLRTVSLRNNDLFLFFGFFLSEGMVYLFVLIGYFFCPSLGSSQPDGCFPPDTLFNESHLFFLVLKELPPQSKTPLYDWSAKSKFMMFI